MTTENLVIIAALVVLAAVAAWYVRGRGARGDTASADAAAAREVERQQASAAAEAVQTDALVRRHCPHCAEEVDVRAGACVQCGYRFG